MVGPPQRSLVRDVTGPSQATDDLARQERVAERARLQATGWTIIQAAAQTGRPQALVRHAMFYGLSSASPRIGYPDDWGIVRAFPQDVQRLFPKPEEAKAAREQAEQAATEPHHIQRARARMARREATYG